MQSTRFCPAKINLHLEVGQKRSDGFHSIFTLFHSLDIGDTLKARADKNIHLQGSETVTPNQEDNLIIKAARLLHRECALASDQGIAFQIEKKLPAGAGLGGGSSNAAMALDLCNEIWKLGLSRNQLLALAPKLGADVAFFLKGKCCYASGIGDELSDAPEIPKQSLGLARPSILILTPQVHVDTAWAYRNLKSNRTGSWEAFKEAWNLAPGSLKAFNLAQNHFEQPVCEHFSEIAELEKELQKSSAFKIMLSGSGASLYALFLKEEDAFSELARLQGLCRYAAVAHFT